MNANFTHESATSRLRDRIDRIGGSPAAFEEEKAREATTRTVLEGIKPSTSSAAQTKMEDRGTPVTTSTPAQNTAELITRPSPTAYPLPLSAAPSARSTHVKREETKVPDTTGEGQPASHDADPPPRVSKGKLIVALPAQNTAGVATDALLAPGPTPMTDILAPAQPQ
ncbi:hypothetical protein GQ602_004722 [Ophiocordyceps camponoti-floridani]|uniref:Uncharacterized protein n=1 Tax=Ophiocordyceps camponoti-floridani TaxID=2030778 RepID=A0A8H4Q4C8_9HYPO|nr:hypothetical protein GQ602_004722 [Ophiocordyceps camponoti-floridani]